jgi:diguanylate cyclase (GGDEF)-like protein
MMVAEQIGLGLANLRLRDTLRMQSVRDPLTGLFNRRYMEESLERELRRAARKEGPLGIFLFDIDYFKGLNDSLGHEVGDTLLRDLGTFLQAHVRAEDVACRYGGDEFILILPKASLAVTRQRAEQLRETVKHLGVHHHCQHLGTITLSLGMAVYPEHGITVQELLRSADEALYRSKKQGGDRVLVGKAAS